MAEADDDIQSSSSSTVLYDGGKRCTLFVIDFGEAMFNVSGVDSQKCFRFTLKAVRDRINYLCCTGENNELIAVIFYNTLNTNKDAENVDCVFVHRPVGVPDAEYVKQLDELLLAKNLREELAPFLGAGFGLTNWGELLFLCQRMLTYSGVVLRRRQIFFFSINSDPTMGDPNIERIVRNYISDLRARDTQLSVCLVDVALKNDDSTRENEPIMDDGETSLAIHSLWKEIDPNVELSSSFSRIDEVMRKDVAMRTTTSIPMRLGGKGMGDDADAVVFAVGVYSLIREQKRPVAIPLDAETNERLEFRAHYVTANDSGEGSSEESRAAANAKLEVDGEAEHFEGEVNFRHQVGGVNLIMDRTEMEQLRRLDDPGLTVIGFKPLKFLKHSHRMGPSKFIYPLDDVVNGSATLYRALLARCLELELFMLARYTEKRNTAPQLVALVPQRRKPATKTAGDDYTYEGFHLIQLPYAEDKRSLEDRMSAVPNCEPTPKQVEIAKAFVKRLTTKYAPHQFTNSVLQRFYLGLETMALDLDIDQMEENPRIADKIRAYFENETLRNRVATQLDALKKEFPYCVPGASAPQPTNTDEGVRKRQYGGRKKADEPLAPSRQRQNAARSKK